MWFLMRYESYIVVHAVIGKVLRCNRSLLEQYVRLPDNTRSTVRTCYTYFLLCYVHRTLYMQCIIHVNNIIIKKIVLELRVTSTYRTRSYTREYVFKNLQTVYMHVVAYSDCSTVPCLSWMTRRICITKPQTATARYR